MESGELDETWEVGQEETLGEEDDPNMKTTRSENSASRTNSTVEERPTSKALGSKDSGSQNNANCGETPGSYEERKQSRGQKRRGSKLEREPASSRKSKRDVNQKESGQKCPSASRRQRRRQRREVSGVGGRSNGMRRRKTRRTSRRANGLSHYEIENVPKIPLRVFKAFRLLKHERFLRVASKYLKPKF